MQEALINIFNTILTNVIRPITNAMTSTKIISPLIAFINGLTDNVLRMFNNENTMNYQITIDLVSYIIGFILIVIIFEIVYAIFRIVFVSFETIQKNINSFDNKQKWKKRGGHKKK